MDLRRQTVTLKGRWNWLRIMSNGKPVVLAMLNIWTVLPDR